MTLSVEGRYQATTACLTFQGRQSQALLVTPHLHIRPTVAGLQHLDLALNELSHAALGSGLEHLSGLTALTGISLLACRLQELPIAVMKLPKLEVRGRASKWL